MQVFRKSIHLRGRFQVSKSALYMRLKMRGVLFLHSEHKAERFTGQHGGANGKQLSAGMRLLDDLAATNRREYKKSVYADMSKAGDVSVAPENSILGTQWYRAVQRAFRSDKPGCRKRNGDEPSMTMTR